MNNKIVKIGLVFCLYALLSSTTVMGQARVGTSAATFLTLGTGAHGSSLGHAYTAAATGGDALFWNPAGAARSYQGARGAGFFTHFEWVADINYNAAAVVIPASGSGVLGLSIASVDYGRMDVRTVDLPEGTGETFGASDMSIGISYAQPLTSTFYFGGTVKYIRQTIRDMEAATAAIDLGFVLETEYLNGARVAASIMNFGGNMTMRGVNTQIFTDVDPDNNGSNPNIPADLATDSWALPLSFKFGIDVPVVVQGNTSFNILADAHQTNDNSLNSDLGAQLRYQTRTITFDLRAGYKDLFLEDEVDNHLSFGAGLDVQLNGGLRLGMDYGYLPFDLLGSAQMIDFRFAF
jgi:hypothetical protein